MFGQIVIGPPGAGKTTYCDSMSQLLRGLNRKVAILNIDPANEGEALPYEASIDISDLIQLEDVMNEPLNLGPNGGLVYCIEHLEKNFEWLATKIKNELQSHYLIIDCPGQVELYTHNNAVKNIISRLEKECSVRLCAVHLVDSHYCADASKFVAVCLTSLTTMLQLELPHVNILSKVDLVEKYGKLDFNIDYYTEVQDLEYLLDRISDDPFTAKFKKLNEAMTGLVSDYSLVNFMPLTVKSKAMMLAVKDTIDKANGYCFTSVEEANAQRLMAFSSNDFNYAKIQEVQENFMGANSSTSETDEDDTTERDAPKVKKSKTTPEKIGNDLDNIDVSAPGFQI